VVGGRLLRRLRGPRPDPRLSRRKLQAIDVAFQRLGATTLADLGAVWAVDAGYSFYALDRHGADRVVICDDAFTEPVVERQRRDPRVELVRGNFGTTEVAARVGQVDVILMLDVLLHQVDPDWDAILALYATRTRCMVLSGPWWNGAETVRLLDLGREAYLRTVPLPDFHRPILDKLDEVNPRRGRPWRDVHDIWQWGITDADLRATMHALGFELGHYEGAGRWRGSPRFDEGSYVFLRAA
jgi:hypothetical protein